MNAMMIAEDYIRDERDFLTPLSPIERILQLITGPQAVVAPFVFPVNSVPAIDISGIGQTKAIATAFPQLYAAGWKLLIMRASIGLTPDTLFDYFWRAGYDAGMYMIVYHLVYPGISGISQANVFLKAIDPMLTAIDGHSAAVRDVEVAGNVTAWRNTITDFGTIVTPKLPTGDYSSVSKWLSCTNNMTVPGFAWNASWSNKIDVPSFAPVAKTVLRQVGVYLKHEWVSKPPGVNEDVDVDYYMGTEQELRKFLGYDDTSPTPPPSSDLELRVTNLENRVNTLDAENDAEHQKMQEDIINLRSDVDALKESTPNEPPTPDPTPDPEPAPNTWTMTVRPENKDAEHAKVYCFEVWNEKQSKLVEKRNGEKKPIMQEYFSDDGKRIVYDRNAPVITYKSLIDTDGSTPDCYEIYKKFGDHGARLFLRKTDVMKPY